VEHISLEHANITVSDPEKTAAWMQAVFGWRIRWQGPALESGFTFILEQKLSIWRCIALQICRKHRLIHMVFWAD
jgi:catechol 2,3-dioxygenase-like lactoylglutathione lyase family enzyme